MKYSIREFKFDRAGKIFWNKMVQFLCEYYQKQLNNLKVNKQLKIKLDEFNELS